MDFSAQRHKSFRALLNAREAMTIAIRVQLSPSIVDTRIVAATRRAAALFGYTEPAELEHDPEDRMIDRDGPRQRAEHRKRLPRREARQLVAHERAPGRETVKQHAQQAESGARKQSRGGKGRITMKVTEKTGAVVGALTVRDNDEIMLITVGGQMVRTAVKDIREAGRNTQGVKLIELEEGDRLQAIAPVISEADEDAAENAQPAES